MLNLIKVTKYLAQHHPNGDLWNYREGRPVWPTEWNEWETWLPSEKKLYFLALNFWNGLTVDAVPVDPHSLLAQLDSKQQTVIFNALQAGTEIPAFSGTLDGNSSLLDID